MPYVYTLQIACFSFPVAHQPARSIISIGYAHSFRLYSAYLVWSTFTSHLKNIHVSQLASVLYHAWCSPSKAQVGDVVPRPLCGFPSLWANSKPQYSIKVLWDPPLTLSSLVPFSEAPLTRTLPVSAKPTFPKFLESPTCPLTLGSWTCVSSPWSISPGRHLCLQASLPSSSQRGIHQVHNT